MTTPDQRIRLPGAKINFSTDVGTTGQDHDTFPAPGQARYDHMRMYLLGLLSNQASYSEPTQYREGSFWFDLNTLTFKIYVNDSWSSLSETILLGFTPLPKASSRTVLAIVTLSVSESTSLIRSFK